MQIYTLQLRFLSVCLFHYVLTYFTVASLPSLLTATPIGAVGVDTGALMLARIGQLTLVGVVLTVLAGVGLRALTAEAILQIYTPSIVHTGHCQTLLDI